MPNARRSWLALLWFSAVLVGLAVRPAHTSERPARDELQDIVDDLKRQLGIDAPVTAAIVSHNPRLVSVNPVQGTAGTFVMSFEEGFVAEVDADELRAIVAHELGHVWIFTHHPYLQTERLANSIALRVVSRASLERVYARVWQRDGTKGDLTQFLGQ